MGTNHRNAKSIFLDAVEIASAAKRRAYVVTACAGDDALLREIEDLLCHHEGLGSFLEGAGVAPLASAVVSAFGEGPGAVLGPYKLLEQIGEGGFGIVFMAEQSQPVRRKVALKVLKPGMDTRQVVARFEAERQALALMDHVNIARVLDAGATESGLPFFVMELVRGVLITDFCDENSLPVRERLELFLHVCRAVQHAHQKGVIHRDIKPSNVLVTLHDGAPVAKVIDFGIAKATGQRLTDKTLFTSFDQMIGSPLYMSPEQAEMSGLDIDTRADIYSLGVLLYELLTGTTPFDHERLRSASFDEIRRIIREEEPPKPSTRITTLGQAATTASTRRRSDPRRLGRLFRGELDWVVMKCLEKDRNRRYETANGLARDVERYLHDEPVHACPPSALYRFRKAARRHKVALGIASAAAILVLLGVVGLAVSYTWVKRERDGKVVALAAAQANFAKAEEQRQAADESSRTARQAVDEFFTQMSENTLLDVPGLQPLRKDLLEAALKYHKAFLERRSLDPELQADAAASYFRVAQIYNIMDKNDDAVRAVQQGLDIAEKLVRDYPDRPGLALRLAGFYKSGRLFHRGSPLPSNPRAAVRWLEKGAELWERFVRDNPTAAQLRSDLAGIHGYLAAIQLARRQYAAALASFQKVEGMWAELVAEYPAAPDYRAELAGSRDRIGELLRRAKRPQEAENAFRQALELWEELAASFPQRAGYRMELAECYNALARRLTRARKYQEADDAVARALAILTKLVADAPNVPAYRDTLGLSYTELASSLQRQGRRHESAVAYRQALAAYDKLAPEFPAAPRYRERLARCFELLSLVLLDSGASAEAATAHGRAVAAQEILVAEFPAVTGYQEELCSMVNVWPNPPDREVKLALEVASGAVTRGPNNGTFWKLLGGAQYRAGNWDAAETTLEKALALGAGKGCWFFLAMIHAKRGNQEEAASYYRQAVVWLEKNRTQNERRLRLRAEAEELLGSQRAAPKPAPVRKN